MVQITLPDSGHTCTWPDLPPGALDAIVRAAEEAHPKPAPPTDAQLADPNTREAAVDAYVRQLMSRYGRVLDQVVDRVIPLIAQHLADSVDAEGVRALRADMAAIGTPIDPAMDDREVFLRHLCFASFNDRHVMHQALIKLSPRLRNLSADDPRWRATEG
jgi:hypothetical protein